MPYRVTLADVVPSARESTPWVTARMEEAPARRGPWTPIGETFTLTPETDPSKPEPRTFITDAATLVSGWYRVLFTDTDGETEESDPVLNGPDFRPTADQLAALMPARAFDRDGYDDAGVFRDPDENGEGGTRPSKSQAERMITLALPLVIPRLGEVGDSLVDTARTLVALRAAMMVETGLFPGEVSSDDSAYARLREQYQEALADYDEVAKGNVGPAPGGARVASVPVRTIYTA